ncbi:MAG TPA: DUF4157 domain-containing protein [Woeseiaceae bacterium]|nr:DUF4157 domain-containing protein [Woeseiaceae bacterium]
MATRDVGRAKRWRPLTAGEKAALASCIPEPDLEAAVLRLDRVPWYLPRRFNAVTRGNRIYVRPGACRTDTPEGLALLAHELAHVGQYRRGATWLTFLLSYLRHGYWNSPLEVEARQAAERIRRARPAPATTRSARGSGDE